MILWMLLLLIAMAGTFVVGYTDRVAVDADLAQIARFGFFGCAIAFTGALLAALFRTGPRQTR